MKSWSTQAKDMGLAKLIIDQYVEATGAEAVGLFEIVMNPSEKRMNYQLAAWVIVLAQQFSTLYGAEKGDFVTREVISRCLIGNEQVH